MTSKCESLGFSVSEGVKQSFYRRYTAMRDRCYNPNRFDYSYYGGKGIKVKWQCFPEFLNDMWHSFIEHVKEHGVANTTLDRINPNGHYSKDNCRWATRKKQSDNQQRTKKLIYKGKEYSLRQLAIVSGVSEMTLWRRLYRHGMSIKEAVETPVKRGANQYGK